MRQGLPVAFRNRAPGQQALHQNLSLRKCADVRLEDRPECHRRSAAHQVDAPFRVIEVPDVDRFPAGDMPGNGPARQPLGSEYVLKPLQAVPSDVEGRAGRLLPYPARRWPPIGLVHIQNGWKSGARQAVNGGANGCVCRGGSSVAV